MKINEFMVLCKELRDKVEASDVVGIDGQLAASLLENEAEFSIRVRFRKDSDPTPIFVNKGTR